MIGLIGRFRVPFNFVNMQIFFTKTTIHILVALATVGLTRCFVYIPLPFAALTTGVDREKLYTALLTHIIVTYCLLLCSSFCFVSNGCDMNDTFLLLRRIQDVLVSTLGVGTDPLDSFKN